LRVACFRFELLDFGIDVAVANQDVSPAVVVEAENAAAPAKILRVLAKTALKRGVFEACPAEIAVERWSVASKIGFDEVEIAVEIIIGSGDAHAGLRLAVGAQRAAGFQCNVNERPVFLVLVWRTGCGIVGDVNVRPSVVVEIGGEHAKAIGAIGFEDAGCFTDVGKCAVTVVVIQNIFSAVEPWRTASHHDAFVQTRAGFGYGGGLQIEIDVIRDEKIDVAVAVVVDESAACVPALAASGHAGFLANVSEGAVPVVVVENIFSEVGDEEIVEPVVVVVADAHALPPAGMYQTGFGGDVGEGAVTIVLEKMRKGFLSGGKAFETPAVHEKNIQPAVVVVIVESDSAASGFEEI